MRRSTQLVLRTLRHVNATATVQVTEPLATCRHACAALPALSGLAQASHGSQAAFAAASASQLSSSQPWQSWSPAAAAPGDPAWQWRSFVSKPLRNKRAQAALERQKRLQKQQQAAPATYNADPKPASSAEPGSEIMPSDAAPSAVEVPCAATMTCSSAPHVSLSWYCQLQDFFSCAQLIVLLTWPLDPCFADCKCGGPPSAYHHTKHRMVSNPIESCSMNVRIAAE